MKYSKSLKREKKNKKNRYGMRVSNRGIKLLVEILTKKAGKNAESD